MFPDWVLKTSEDLDGVPLSYIDMLERSESEERRREREVQIMQEGKWVQHITAHYSTVQYSTVQYSRVQYSTAS